jgi:hypothetical protein
LIQHPGRARGARPDFNNDPRSPKTDAATFRNIHINKKEIVMKPTVRLTLTAGMAVLMLGTAPAILGAESAERAMAAKEKINALRLESSKVRNQITVTLEELNRMTVKGIELRPQFERYKAELVKMEEQAVIARDRADSMQAKGHEAFQAWEKEVQAIQNPDIRKEAQKRYDKRKKSYDRIIAAMQDAKKELVPFMSNLNDVRKLLDSELTESTVNATKGSIKQARWQGEDVQESLLDVEKELDRVAADLAKYQ